MADEWNYEGALTWDGGGGGAPALSSYPVMLTSGAATFLQSDVEGLTGATALSVLLERVGLPLTGKGVRPSSVKMITGIWPIISGTPGDTVQVYIGSQVNSPTEAPVYMGPYTFTIGTTEFIDTLTTGRYGCVRFTSSGMNPWILEGYEIDFQEVGVH